jgi:hypothetical protein
VRTTSLREWKSRRVDINLEVVVPDFIFMSIAADMIGYISPRAEAIDFCAFQ